MYNPKPLNNDFLFPFQCEMLKLVGSWPFETANTKESKTMKIIYNFWANIVIILIAFTCCAQSFYLIYSWGDIINVTECGCTVLMGIHNLLRLIHLRFKKQSMKVLMKRFVDNIWISGVKEHKIASECEKELVPLKIISMMLFILICMYVIMPIYELITTINNDDDQEKPLPYKMLFPFNVNYSLSYIITYFLTSVAGFGVVITLFAEDSLICFFIIYVCGQFKILHNKINLIMRKGDENVYRKIYNSQDAKDINIWNYHNKMEITILQKEYSLLLKDIISHHNILISFCDELEKFFSPIIFVNFLISSFLICFVGFQIASVKMTQGNLMKFLIYIISALNQLFILCWNGDKLIENSTKTAMKLYECNWEGSRHSGFPIGASFMNDLRFVCCRSQKPIKITALKFWVLSLQSFTKILSTSISYFTLLQTLVD